MITDILNMNHLILEQYIDKSNNIKFNENRKKL